MKLIRVSSIGAILLIIVFFYLGIEYPEYQEQYFMVAIINIILLVFQVAVAYKKNYGSTFTINENSRKINKAILWYAVLVIILSFIACFIGYIVALN